MDFCLVLQGEEETDHCFKIVALRQRFLFGFGLSDSESEVHSSLLVHSFPLADCALLHLHIIEGIEVSCAVLFNFLSVHD